MTSLFDLQDLLDPGDDLVGTGVGWLVQVDDTVVLESFDRALGGRETAREGCEVGGLNVELVKVLTQNDRTLIEVK